MELFLNADITNTTELSLANFQDIYSSIIKDRGSSALWFYPAAVSHHLSFCDSFADDLSFEQGATILALVLMSLIKGLPRGE
jgi:hypothetical protein